MTRASNIVVAGAGAVGGAIAFGLARAGFRVLVADPAPMGANASGVAAGMLAPAFESLFDDPSPRRFALLAAARDAWAPLADRLALPLDRRGALAAGNEAEVEGWRAGLAALGAEGRRLSAPETQRLAPRLRPGLAAVFSPDDWRLDPLEALASLRRAAEEEGARFVAGRLVGFDHGRARIGGHEPVDADLAVLATGAARELEGLAPELGALTPVKGHILRSRSSWQASCVVRGTGVYLCPSAEGTVLGASMEVGVGDTGVDPNISDALLARAEALAPGIGRMAWRAEAGVRAATPDGLPLVGFSAAPGVVLAAGARRNGWLLAPVIAEAVLALAQGRGSAAAAAFDPARAAIPG